MEQSSSIRLSKMFYLGLPILLLVLYVIFIPSPSVSQIYLQDSLGYIAEGYNFTILRLSTAGQIIPISSYDLSYRVKNFTIENGLAYVLTGDNSIHIIDVREPSNPIKLGNWDSPALAHSVAVDGGFAYVANHTDGVRVLSVHQPSSPYIILHLNNLGTVLDVAATPNLIYIARGPDGLDIYDTSSVTKPTIRGHYDAGGSINQITFLPENKALLLVDNHRLQIINISNSQNILLMNSFTFDNDIMHAILNNNRIFIAQKRAGLLITRIKDDGTLETLKNFRPRSNVQGVAVLGEIVFMAAGPGGVQAINISKLDDIQPTDSYSRYLTYKLFIGALVVTALLFWLSFFAQFVLPVRTFTQRQKIFSRLSTFLIGRHGPATIIENGYVRARTGEIRRKGPGVLWLDTASATVIRTATKFKEAIGPGVHFTENKEFIASTVDLHTQVDLFGPSDDEDNPFIPKPDANADQTEKDKYDKIQKRRMEVSALTRDGIEVVPKISITFRVDTMPAEGDQQPGSRFGYRTGTSKKDKENETKDKDAIYKAITGEGIKPNIPTEMPRHRVAWNHLPILLAVDVWREYVAKFTLDELFTATQEVPPSPPVLPQPTDEEIGYLNEPIQVGPKQESFQERYASTLHNLNERITLWLDNLEGKKTKKVETPKAESFSPLKAGEASKKTALQVINDMVKARLTMPEVEEIDPTGRRLPDKKPGSSYEYRLLSARGLKVISVSISNPRVNEVVEKQRISQWAASWLSNAKAERDRIERQRGFVEIQGQEQSANKYAHALAFHIMKQRPHSIKDTVKALLMRTRLIIVRNDQLQRRMSTERQDLEDILQWMENSS
jgi:hypothetical protein